MVCPLACSLSFCWYTGLWMPALAKSGIWYQENYITLHYISNMHFFFQSINLSDGIYISNIQLKLNLFIDPKKIIKVEHKMCTKIVVRLTFPILIFLENSTNLTFTNIFFGILYEKTRYPSNYTIMFIIYKSW